MLDCSEYAKIGEEGQIIIDQIIYNYISDYIEVEEIIQKKKNKLYSIVKLSLSIKLSNKIIINNKLNFFDKLILSKRDIILNFFPNYIFRAISEKGCVINGRWIKETKFMTILMLRPTSRKGIIYEVSKINELINIINGLINEFGGLMFKIMNDEKGIVITIIFGLKKFTSKFKDELMSVIFAFEATKKLKEINIYPYIGISSNLVLLNLNKFSGSRRDFNVIGNAFIEAFQCLEESEKNIYNKNIGDNSIIIEKNTMEMIDSLIPCRYLKKIKNKFLQNDLFLFVPQKINKIHFKNIEDNIIPLIGSHLHFFNN